MCLSLAAVLLLYIALMKRTSERRKKRIASLQKRLAEVEKSRKTDSSD